MTPDERRRAHRAAAPPEDVPAERPACAEPAVLTPRPASPASVNPGPDRPIPADVPGPPDFEQVRLRPRQRPPILGRRLELDRERRWTDCLFYPLLAVAPLAVLTGGLTLLSTVTANIAPLMFAGGGPEPLVTATVWALFLLLPLAGCVCDFLGGVLTSAAAGEPPYFLPADFQPGRVVRSLAAWIICFLAGPVLPFAAALFYWLRCGDPVPIDWLVIGELLAVGCGTWQLLLLAGTRRERLSRRSAFPVRLRDLHPVAVAALFNQLGPRLLVTAILAAALLLGLGWYGMLAVAELHRSPVAGFLEVAGCWFLFLFLSTFLMRLLGLWAHRVPRSAR